MSDSLQITKELTNSAWVITGRITVTGVLPEEIFIYENTGTDVLGKYVGVCNLQELQRMQVWSGASIPKFGNKYVRYGQAKINLSLDSDIAFTISHMVASTKSLKAEMVAAASTTTVYPI